MDFETVFTSAQQLCTCDPLSFLADDHCQLGTATLVGSAKVSSMLRRHICKLIQVKNPAEAELCFAVVTNKMPMEAQSNYFFLLQSSCLVHIVSKPQIKGLPRQCKEFTSCAFKVPSLLQGIITPIHETWAVWSTVNSPNLSTFMYCQLKLEPLLAGQPP